MKFAALLRGINVGGKSKVEMAKLKKSFVELGFKNVATYINSGNVIFEGRVSERHAKTIENYLEKIFGFEIKVVVVDEVNIKKLVEKIPTDWTNNDDQKTDIIFLKNENEKIKYTTEVDNLIYFDKVIAWNIRRENYFKSGMKKFVGTEIYKNMTARNVNTVRKLNELLDKS